MMTSLPFRPVIAFGFTLLTAGVGARPALAFHKKQHVPVQATTVASAPTYTTTAAAPPTIYYSVPNPTASAPAQTYVISGTAAAPATAPAPPSPSPTVASAPTAAGAPSSGSTLLGGAFRSALFEDLKKLYKESGTDTTRGERVDTLRQEGRTAYAKYLGDGDQELDQEQKRDLDTLIDAIVANDINTSTSGTGGYYPSAPYTRTAYAPYATYGAPTQVIYGAAPSPVIMTAPTLVPLVPVQLVPYAKHRLCNK